MDHLTRRERLALLAPQKNQAEIARAAKVSPPALSNWLNDACRKPTLSKLAVAKVAASLGSADYAQWLTDGTGTVPKTINVQRRLQLWMFEIGRSVKDDPDVHWAIKAGCPHPEVDAHQWIEIARTQHMPVLRGFTTDYARLLAAYTRPRMIETTLLDQIECAQRIIKGPLGTTSDHQRGRWAKEHIPGWSHHISSMLSGRPTFPELGDHPLNSELMAAIIDPQRAAWTHFGGEHQSDRATSSHAIGRLFDAPLLAQDMMRLIPDEAKAKAQNRFNQRCAQLLDDMRSGRYPDRPPSDWLEDILTIAEDCEAMGGSIDLLRDDNPWTTFLKDHKMWRQRMKRPGFTDLWESAVLASIGTSQPADPESP